MNIILLGWGLIRFFALAISTDTPLFVVRENFLYFFCNCQTQKLQLKMSSKQTVFWLKQFFDENRVRTKEKFLFSQIVKIMLENPLLLLSHTQIIQSHWQCMLRGCMEFNYNAKDMNSVDRWFYDSIQQYKSTHSHLSHGLRINVHLQRKKIVWLNTYTIVYTCGYRMCSVCSPATSEQNIFFFLSIFILSDLI